jgi:hypothetical protein
MSNKGEDQAFGLYFDGAFFTSESHSSPQNSPGRVVWKLSKEGMRLFRYQKAEEAFAIGQVSMISALIDNADVDQAQAIGDTILKATGDFTANEFNDGTFPSAYVTIDAGTGAGQTRSIERNRGSTDFLSLESNGWDVALDTTSDYVTYDINYVSLCDTDDVSQRASNVRGVAISAVTDEQWAWFQVGGFCPLVRFIGSTDAAIRGAIIVPSGTAGAARGPTAGGTTADEATNAFGIALHAYSAGDSAGLGIAAILHCRYAIF